MDSLANGLQNGIYTVTITDNNACEWDTTIMISQNLGPQIQSLSADSVSCYSQCDGSASVTASGNGSLSYNWNDLNASDSTFADNLCPGYYSVVVTDPAGCSATDSVLVLAPDSLIISISSTDDTGSCNGSASALVSGGTPPYSFAWNDPMNQTLDSISNLCNGTYTLILTDGNGCSSSIQIDIDDINSLLENESKLISIYPNPTQALLNITTDYTGNIHWSITEVNGKEILKGNAVSNSFQVNVNELANGLYFFNITHNGAILSKVFIKD